MRPRTTSTRLCTSPGARWAPRRSSSATSCCTSPPASPSTSRSSSGQPSMPAVQERPPRTGRRWRCTAVSSSPRTATRTGSEAAGTSSPSSRPPSPTSWGSSASVEGVRGLPLDATSFVGRERELDQLETLLHRDKAPHTHGSRRRRQDPARARAGTRGRGFVRGWSGARRARARGRAGARRGGGRRRARCAGAARPGSGRRRGRVPGRAVAPARAGQLRARPRRRSGAVADRAASLGPRRLRSSRPAASRCESRARRSSACRRSRSRTPEGPIDRDDLLGYESICLFVERAGAAAPGFALDDRERSRTSMRICYRLDGMPLAIELAAGPVGSAGSGRDCREAGRPLSAVACGQPLRADAPADARGDARMEPRAARGRRADAPPPPGRLRRRLRPVRGRGRVRGRRPRSPRDRRRAGTARREVARRRRRPRSRPALPAAGDGPALRRRPAGRGRRVGEAREEPRRIGRSTSPGGNATTRASTARPRTSRQRSIPCSAVDQPAALRLCVALWPFWLRRIDLEEGHRRLEEALAAVPERTETRAAGSAGRLGTRPAGSGALSTAPSPRRSSASAVAEEIDDRMVALACSPLPRRDRDLAGRFSRRRRDLRPGAGARAARRLCRAEPHWASIRSPSPVGGWATSRTSSSSSPRASRSSSGSGDSPEADPDTGQRRRHAPRGRVRARAAEGVRGHPAAASSRSRATAAVGYVLANQAQIARERGHPDRSRKLLDESMRDLRGVRTTGAASRTLSSAKPIWSWRQGISPPPARRSIRRSTCAGASGTGEGSAWRFRVSGWSMRRRATTTGPSSCSQRPATCSGARETGGD